MAKYLVIVESPAKVKTIKKFLGKNYEVMASNGHVRDLPKSQLGIDVEGDFEPKYITIRGKGEILSKLRKEAKKADKIYLATDPDREGEAISWHLAFLLGIVQFRRILRDVSSCYECSEDSSRCQNSIPCGRRSRNEETRNKIHCSDGR